MRHLSTLVSEMKTGEVESCDAALGVSYEGARAGRASLPGLLIAKDLLNTIIANDGNTSATAGWPLKKKMTKPVPR